MSNATITRKPVEIRNTIGLSPRQLQQRQAAQLLHREMGGLKESNPERQAIEAQLLNAFGHDRLMQLAAMLETAAAIEEKPPVKTTAKQHRSTGVKAKVSKAAAFDGIEPGSKERDIFALPTMQLTYRELQRYLKHYGVSGRGDTATLRARVDGIKFEPSKFAKFEASEVKATKAQAKAKATAKKSKQPKQPKEKRNVLGLSYRHAQRLVSWFKANMPSSQLPELVKNIGWDNVELNVISLLSTPWAAKLTIKQWQSVAQAIALDDTGFTRLMVEVGLAA